MSREIIKNREINKRLEKIREYYELSQYSISKKLGISGAYYSDITNVKTGVGMAVVIGIAENFPEINLRWFLTGEGEMLEPRSQPKGDSIAVKITEYQASTPPPKPHEKNEVVKKIMAMVETMPEEDQSSVMMIIQGILRILRK